MRQLPAFCSPARHGGILPEWGGGSDLGVPSFFLTIAKPFSLVQFNMVLTELLLATLTGRLSAQGILMTVVELRLALQP